MSCSAASRASVFVAGGWALENAQSKNPCWFFAYAEIKMLYISQMRYSRGGIRLNQYHQNGSILHLTDYGPEPFVVNIDQVTRQNSNYRTALWTGHHLQLTLMSIPVGGEIGLEVHHDNDQFLRIESGNGTVMMGLTRDKLNHQRPVGEGYAIFVPAGIWHNVINTDNRPLHLYTVYAPPHHPHGTVHKTKAHADAQEH